MIKMSWLLIGMFCCLNISAMNEKNSPVPEGHQIIRVPAMRPHEIFIADFEKQLRQPPKQNFLPEPEATSIAAQHKLQIPWLSNYYCRLHSWSKLIVYFAEACCGIDKMDENARALFRRADNTAMPLNPGRGQIEPNGGVAIEFSWGFPIGFWTVLGFLPIASRGIVQDSEKKESFFRLINNFLGTHDVKTLDETTSLAICNPPCGNECQNVVVRTYYDEIPCEHAVTLWNAVRPHDRQAEPVWPSNCY